MYYRILRQVDKGGPVGALCRFEWLLEEQRQWLVELQVISPLRVPPLAILPGWERRSARLQKLDLLMADEFLEADVAEVAKYMRVKPTTVERWQDEVMNHLVLPKKRGSG